MFLNALYITEKFFYNGLQSGSVPVVSGAPRKHYEKFAPASSFIHVDDFDSVKLLAAYLNHLMVNESAYKKYFDWYKLEENLRENLILTDEKSEAGEGLCKLCQSMHDIRNGVGLEYPVIENLQKWWNGADDGLSEDVCES